MGAATQTCSPVKNAGCQKQQNGEDCFSRIAGNAINKSGNRDLKVLLAQHNQDLQAQRRAAAATAVYEIDPKGQLAKPPACLKLLDTSSETSLRQLESDLNLEPNSLQKSDFESEQNGFRAAVFYDQREEKYLVTFRGTNKNNLIDWKNNINNQLPNATESDAPSYFAANNLGGLLKNGKPAVEYVGHSKGGGEVYEALSNSPKSLATVFNAAGPSPRISEAARNQIAGRTQNYQVGGEMLNLMQNETEPEKTIANMRWLRKQVDDGITGDPFASAVEITERDNLTALEKAALGKKTGYIYNWSAEAKAAQARLDELEKNYKDERQAFISQLDEQIGAKQKWLDDKRAGKEVPPWLPPFAKSLGNLRVLGGSPDRNEPGLGALSDHTMKSMNAALKKQIDSDHKALQQAAQKLDPNFDKKVRECSSGA